MAFQVQGLMPFNSGGALGGGAGSVKTLWHYASNDADTLVEADGYFDQTALNQGDLLLASLDLDGTPEVKLYVVAAGSGDPAANDVAITPMLIA